MKDLSIIVCPPLSDYPEAPKDQSHCELFDCPKCKQKMWLSEKIKGVIMFSAVSGNDIFLACYRCLEKLVKDDPEFFPIIFGWI
jgi:hypothetical protein